MVGKRFMWLKIQVSGWGFCENCDERAGSVKAEICLT